MSVASWLARSRLLSLGSLRSLSRVAASRLRVRACVRRAHQLCNGSIHLISTMAMRDSTSAASDGARLNGLGVLSVHVRGAHGLKAADSNGLSDPYAICHVLSESRRTHVVRKSLDPVWGETLEFGGVKLGDVVARGIRLELLDHDVFSRHDPLGELVVDLSQLATVDSWVYSEALPTQGTVEFTVSWIEQDSRLAGTGTLTIRLLRATGLAAADSNGLSDPYVRLSLGSIKHKSKVTHPQP